MLKNVMIRFGFSMLLTACGAQDASIQLQDTIGSVERSGVTTSVNPNNPSDPSGTLQIIAPKQDEILPYSKFKLIFSIQDSDLLKDYTIKLDGSLISGKLASGYSLYVEKEIPITSCYLGMIVAPGEHEIEVSYHDRLGNELKAEVLFSLKQ
jgi:hypothetical protein